MVQDDLDILSAGASYDGEYLYLAMNVQGQVSPGTVSPFSAHIYSVGIYYPDRISEAIVRPDLLLEYAEHARMFALPDRALLDMNRDMGEMRNAGTRVTLDRGRLMFRIRADALKNGFDQLRVIYGTAYVRQLEFGVHATSTSVGNLMLDVGLSDVQLDPVDATAFANIVRADRSFTVGEPSVVGLAR